MSREKSIGVDLSDNHARISFSIEGYRSNGYSVFGEIDNSDILDGSFGYNVYESSEWGAGAFSIRKERIHRIVKKLRAFIHSDESEVHIDEGFRIDIIRNKGEFALSFSMNNQLTGDYITVEETLSYRDLFQLLLKPLYAISETYP